MTNPIRSPALPVAAWLAVLAWTAPGGDVWAQPSAAAAPAASDLHVVKLTNSGKTGITAVYVAPVGSPDMSDDLLGKQTADVGKTVTLRVRDPKAACTFDLQFLMNNGDTVTRKAVNLCETAVYAFSP
jgi:hypothetical protein